MVRQKSWSPARGPYAFDSGAFTHLAVHGAWQVTPKAYVREVRRWTETTAGEGVKPDWVAIQDWPVLDPSLKATGLDQYEHMRRTVRSYLELRDLAPEIPWMPVLQGRSMIDMTRCHGLYDREGVDLLSADLVGVGSIATRQTAAGVPHFMLAYASMGIRLHAFGASKIGLAQYGPFLTSSDSMSWAYAARFGEPLPGCTHKKCSTCLRYALLWREELMEGLPQAGGIARRWTEYPASQLGTVTTPSALAAS